MKQYSLMILLAIMAVILGLIKWKYGYKGGELPAKPTPTQIALTTSSPTPLPTPDLERDYQIWDKIPYSGKDFIIVDYAGPKMLDIKTANPNQKAVSKEVMKWLASQKVATESYKLIFIK